MSRTMVSISPSSAAETPLNPAPQALDSQHTSSPNKHQGMLSSDLEVVVIIIVTGYGTEAAGYSRQAAAHTGQVTGTGGFCTL